jgi:hypothetical protein
LGAWKATLDDGTTLTFNNLGIYNAQLMISDRQTGSVWQHCEAVCFHGELEGTVLDEWGPQWHTTWGTWKRWHPDTLVMAEVTDDPLHRDMRHGHGREEYWERRGIGWLEHRYFLGTMQNPPDERLPEQEMVLGVNEPEGVRAYPYRQVKHNGHVVNDDLHGLPLVVWCDPASDGFSTAAYARQADGHVLEFELRDGQFVDRQTGSTWHFEGYATSGPLRGTPLVQLRGYFMRWHAWAAARPKTEVYKTPLKLPEESRWGINEGIFRPLLDAFRSKLSLTVTVEEEIVSYGLPHGTERGIEIRLDGHRFWLYHTHGVEHAKDLAGLPHEWEVEAHCLAHGRFALKDEVDEQWTGWDHVVRLRDNQIAWSPLLKDETFIRVFREACEATDPVLHQTEPAFIDIFKALEEEGQPVEYDHWNCLILPRASLMPHCDFVVQFALEMDRMLLYRFDSPEYAKSYAEKIGHAFAVDNYVFRSTPGDMYFIVKFESGQKPDEKISWSRAIDDHSFRDQCGQIIRRLKTSLQAIRAAEAGD